MGTPAFEKDNAATRLAHEVAAMNRGSPLGRGGLDPMRTISADPQPGVTTPAMRALYDAPPPLASALPPEERERLDRLYGTEKPSGTAGLTFDMIHEVQTGVPPLMNKKLDFSLIQSIDLMRGLVIIDGSAFELTPGKVREYKRQCIDLAMESIVRDVAQALLAMEEVNGQSGEGTAPEAPAEPPTSPHVVPDEEAQPEVRSGERAFPAGL